MKKKNNKPDNRPTKAQMEALQAELKKLQDANSFLKAALENLPNPIFMKDEAAKFVFFNKAYADAFGMSREEYVGKSVLDLDYLPQEDRERYLKEDEEMIKASSIVSYEVDFEFSDDSVHPSYYWSKGIYDEQSDARGLIGEIIDISQERALCESLHESLAELKESKMKLERAAEIEPGTGIFNRMLLHKTLSSSERRSDKPKSSCALLADLDNFKSVNEKYGVVKGDEILQTFLAILKRECREEDIPVRYGGDKFLLILNRANEKIGCIVAERVRRRCESEIVMPDGKPLTCSIGVAEIKDDQCLEELIEELDVNMYTAMEIGRNRVIASDDLI